MSDDMNPAFELDDAPDDPIDSSSDLGTADDFTGAMAMSEFEGAFPGSDSDVTTDPETDSEDGPDASDGSPGSEASDASDGSGDDRLASAMGTDTSTDTEEPSAPAEDSKPTTDGAGDEDESFETESGSSPGDEPAGEESTGDDDAEPSSDTAADGESPEDSPSTDAQNGDLTVSIDGEDIVVGAPTLDITGDGVADTVVVESEGNVEYYVDTDQDGVADQIIVLDEGDGTLVNHEVYDPGTGTWTNVTSDSTGSSD